MNLYSILDILLLFLDFICIKVQKKKRPVGEGVFNLSGVELTRMELSVLDKGLKFAPKR